MGNRPDKSRAETGLQPADLRLTDGQDDAQRDFLDNLANGDRSLGQYEFVRAVQTDFLNVIRDTIAQLQLQQGTVARAALFWWIPTKKISSTHLSWPVFWQRMTWRWISITNPTTLTLVLPSLSARFGRCKTKLVRFAHNWNVGKME